VECVDPNTDVFAFARLFTYGMLRKLSVGTCDKGVCCVQAFQSVFVTNSAWGQFSQTCNAALTSGTVCLTIAYGTQTLSTLNLNIAAKTATVTVGAVNVPCTVTANGTAGVSLAFTSAVTVVAGSVLTVVLTD
jgi:hypothetical protein